jgi:D-3-phosphoglycerate dehydrogenase
MSQEVGIVSAGAFLKERGIEIVEERSTEIGDFSSTLTAETTTDQGTVSLTGTLFGNAMPRLISKDGYRLESYLDGNLLIFEHVDQPGVIGAVGNVFAKHRINIAHMTVGREKSQPGGTAVGVLSLDSVAPAEAIRELLALDAVTKAWSVTLPANNVYPSWMG